MKQEYATKLQALLDKRLQKIESINNFNEYFDSFSFLNLKKVVNQINNALELTTRESLRIFNENPYANSKSNYFIMVQLFSNSYRKSSFLLDNIEKFPALMFEGDEFSASVKATIQFRDKIIITSNYPIANLIKEDNVIEIVIHFLDTVYNL